MKKIFLSIFISSSLLYSTPIESNSLLNYIKEKNGIKLTKEEEYTNFIKKELLNVFDYYIKNKNLTKIDESYFSSINKINSISSFSDVFKIEHFEFSIQNSLEKKNFILFQN